MRTRIFVLSSLLVVTLAPMTRAGGLMDAQRNALRAIARGQSPQWPPLTEAQRNTLDQRAETYFERYQQYHLPFGLSADILWTDRSRKEVAVLEGIGDSAAHTGHYLAAMALRYAADPAPKLLEDMHAVLDRFDVLTRITGREGYIARFAGDLDSKPYYAYYHVYGKGEDPGRPGFGKRAFRGVPPWEDQVWLGWASRDTYAGFQFGLAAVWHYVPEPALHSKIAVLVERVGKRLLADEWEIRDPQGFVTTPIPMMQLTWMRLMLTVCPEVFSAQADAYKALAETCVKRPLDMRGINAKEYYPNNLKFIRMFTLCTLENDGTLKARYQELVRQTWKDEFAHHLNAHFAALYLLLTGDQDSRAIATVQGQLLDFPEDKWQNVKDHRNAPGVEMDSGGYAKHAFLASEWIATDFLWQRAPALAHGGSNAPIEYPGIDYFLPYWTARVAGTLPAE